MNNHSLRVDDPCFVRCCDVWLPGLVVGFTSTEVCIRYRSGVEVLVTRVKYTDTNQWKRFSLASEHMKDISINEWKRYIAGGIPPPVTYIKDKLYRTLNIPYEKQHNGNRYYYWRTYEEEVAATQSPKNNDDDEEFIEPKKKKKQKPPPLPPPEVQEIQEFSKHVAERLKNNSLPEPAYFANLQPEKPPRTSEHLSHRLYLQGTKFSRNKANQVGDSILDELGFITKTSNARRFDANSEYFSDTDSFYGDDPYREDDSDNAPDDFQPGNKKQPTVNNNNNNNNRGANSNKNNKNNNNNNKRINIPIFASSPAPKWPTQKSSNIIILDTQNNNSNSNNKTPSSSSSSSHPKQYRTTQPRKGDLSKERDLYLLEKYKRNVEIEKRQQYQQQNQYNQHDGSDHQQQQQKWAIPPQSSGWSDSASENLSFKSVNSKNSHDENASFHSVKESFEDSSTYNDDNMYFTVNNNHDGRDQSTPSSYYDYFAPSYHNQYINDEDDNGNGGKSFFFEVNIPRGDDDNQSISINNFDIRAIEQTLEVESFFYNSNNHYHHMNSAQNDDWETSSVESFRSPSSLALSESLVGLFD